MGSDHQQVQIIPTATPQTQPRAAVIKTSCRILAAAFLSLLLPLSFLLLSRLSTARYYSPTTTTTTCTTTLILTTLVTLTALATFAKALTGGKIVSSIIPKRHRLTSAWISLFIMQVCLGVGIHGTIDVEINGYTIGEFVLARRVALVLGLHECMVFWWRSVVKPVVDETVPGEELELVEKVVMAVAFGNLWWRRMRDEAEALVVLPWARVAVGKSVGVADLAGWGLYYLTVAIGVVRVVRGGAWVLMKVFKCHDKI